LIHYYVLEVQQQHHHQYQYQADLVIQKIHYYLVIKRIKRKIVLVVQILNGINIKIKKQQKRRRRRTIMRSAAAAAAVDGVLILRAQGTNAVSVI
jgi:hypothetical protein